MYEGLKKIAKFILPKQFLERNETFFRKLISLKYKGDNYQCNICNFNLREFLVVNNENLLCPNCGSLSRTRRLYNILLEENLLSGNVLHFSPPKILHQKFKVLDLNYFSTDFENEFIADYSYDITAIPIENNHFDIIICFHVLEHIENDFKAMSELYRVLKPNGRVFIQTPFKDGDIYEDLSIKSPKKRKELFGQQDHVRIYSVRDLEKRLNNVGFKTKKKNYPEEAYFGFKDETIIIAKK